MLGSSMKLNKQNKFNLWRQSFFEKLKGANENRFIPFNNMPKNYSKYKNIETALSFGTQVDREAEVIGGQTGIDGKKDKFLQDY